MEMMPRLNPKHGLEAEENPMWKGDLASPMTKRCRAQRRYPLTSCEKCGNPATDRHHIDGDPGNNVPSNIARLCRRCHMEIDGRLAIFLSHSKMRPTKPPEPCIVCQRLVKIRRKGRCGACSEFFRRNGVERNLEKAKICVSCETPVIHLSLNMCRSCYGKQWRLNKALLPSGPNESPRGKAGISEAF